MSDVDERWLANQDEFELHQIQKSALLRIIDQRASPIDFLAARPAISLGGFERESAACPQLPSPLEVLDGVQDDKLIELLESVKPFQRIEKRSYSVQFWRSVVDYVNMRLNRAQDNLAVKTVEPDVSNIVNAKSSEELQVLEVEARQQGGDPEYWNGVLELVQQRRARLMFDEISQKVSALVSTRVDFDSSEAKTPFTTFILSTMEPNEVLFDALEADKSAEYVARAIVGTSANFQAHSHSEAHLSNLVQGYKFSIYFPRLSDSENVPKYVLKKNRDGTADLTFSAQGYTDIKFRILDEPWDKPQYSANRFRSTFERGVLQLEFRFKFYYYKN